MVAQDILVVLVLVRNRIAQLPLKPRANKKRCERIAFLHGCENGRREAKGLSTHSRNNHAEERAKRCSYLPRRKGSRAKLNLNSLERQFNFKPRANKEAMHCIASLHDSERGKQIKSGMELAKVWVRYDFLLYVLFLFPPCDSR